MNGRWLVTVAALVLAAFAAPAVAGAGAERETRDVLNQGGAGVYAADAAILTRKPNGLSIKVSMPTPESGSYVYADGTVPGAPEVFTGWAFVFNYPDLCTDGVCDGDDLGDTLAQGGVYNFAGHPAGGSTLTLSGQISVGQPALAPPPIFVGAPLQSPATAEVHVAIAPHGQLDPSQMPEQITTPVGSPACGCWWLALFVD